MYYEGVCGTSGLMVNPLRSLWLREGEVGLSPSLFLVGMDPLLRQLEESCLRLSYSSTISTWGASFILTTSTPGYKHRVSPGSGNFSEEFAAKHFPKLAKSWQKWSGSLARGHQASALVCKVEGSLLPVGSMGKCLGVWWKGNLWCGKKSTAENIKRAFFFLGGLGSFKVIWVHYQTDQSWKPMYCLCWRMNVKAGYCLRVISSCWKPFREKWPNGSLKLNYQSNVPTLLQLQLWTGPQWGWGC